MALEIRETQHCISNDLPDGKTLCGAVRQPGAITDWDRLPDWILEQDQFGAAPRLCPDCAAEAAAMYVRRFHKALMEITEAPA